MSGIERRRPPFDAALFGRVGLAWLAIAGLLLATSAMAIWQRRFPDPDDTLRLVEVRDLLAGQGWFDLHQHRVDALHGGVPMHWSRLVDIPLAGTILLLRPLLGQGGAELAAMVLVPLLTLGCALLLAGRIAWRLFNEEIAGLTCLVMALSVPVIAQLRPMRIDHHGWQIVMALAAMNGLTARSARRGGWITGLALAAWLAVSLEGLPLAAVIVGLVTLRGLRNRAERPWLAHVLQGLAVGSIALFFATRGFFDLAEHCDAIAPVHLAMFAWGALVVTGLGMAGRQPMALTLVGLVAALGGALTILGLAAPQCAGGSFGELDPVVRALWYYHVAEGLPVWRQPLADMLQIVIPPLFGIMAAAKLAARSHDWLHRWWMDYMVLLMAALALSLLVSRTGAVAGALASVPLGWQLREWIRAARNQPALGSRALALTGVALALLPALPLTLFALTAPARATDPVLALVAPPMASNCDVGPAARWLSHQPVAEVLAPLDIGPGLIEQSSARVIATSHHRGARAMRVVIDAFTGSAAQAHAILAARGTAYIALCPGLAEPAVYAQAAPAGLAAQLNADDPPGWLVPVKLGVGNLKLWKVVR